MIENYHKLFPHHHAVVHGIIKYFMGKSIQYALLKVSSRFILLKYYPPSTTLCRREFRNTFNRIFVSVLLVFFPGFLDAAAFILRSYFFFFPGLHYNAKLSFRRRYNTPDKSATTEINIVITFKDFCPCVGGHA